MVLVANVMSMIAEPSNGPGQLKFFAILFLSLSTLYPMPYIYSLRKVRANLKQKQNTKAVRFSLIPLVWTLFTALIMFVWSTVESAQYA